MKFLVGTASILILALAITETGGVKFIDWHIVKRDREYKINLKSNTTCLESSVCATKDKPIYFKTFSTTDRGFFIRYCPKSAIKSNEPPDDSDLPHLEMMQTKINTTWEKLRDKLNTTEEDEKGFFDNPLHVVLIIIGVIIVIYLVKQNTK